MLAVKNNEIKIKQKDIQEFEEEYNVKVPEDFASFLLVTNGGYTKQFLCTPDFEEVDNEGNAFMQSANPDQFYSLEEIKEEYLMNEDDPVFESKYIPIALTGSGSYILLDARDNVGEIYFANHELYDDNDMYIITKLADSFSDFADELKPFEE